jgi:hypothetical protein
MINIERGKMGYASKVICAIAFNWSHRNGSLMMHDA